MFQKVQNILIQATPKHLECKQHMISPYLSSPLRTLQFFQVWKRQS